MVTRRTTNKKGRSHIPIRSASKTIRHLLEILEESEMTYREISTRSGVIGINAPTRWRRGLGTPSIYTVECIADVLGYELALVKK